MKATTPEPAPTFFPTPSKFRAWLKTNHASSRELWVGYYKKATGTPSITWPESVDQALCYGWIDGIRKSIDKTSYKIRFTPRRATSHWSAVNLKRVEELTQLGKMMPSGLAAYEGRTETKSIRYSYEQRGLGLDKAYENKVRDNAKAWAYYKNTLAPSYKKTSVWWVMSAKREETCLRRLDILIASCVEGRKIPLLRKKGE